MENNANQTTYKKTYPSLELGISPLIKRLIIPVISVLKIGIKKPDQMTEFSYI
ncbi:hypothetical protein D9M71_18770 [compost metagenome]